VTAFTRCQPRDAELRWRRCVDEVKTHQAVVDVSRRVVDRVLPPPYLRAKARLWQLGKDGGELEQARAAVDAAYDGRAPLKIIQRLEAYVLERFPEALPPALQRDLPEPE